ncbi:peptidoglycan editing factor PgeF [Rhodobacterales bacterium HKCCE3408]|nr:peptidoglycan editing factor PgeF [Rhodobacterales bacterium HKCCE3408]
MSITTLKLDSVTSDLLGGTVHGFFGRRGGASSGVFEGLNCGPGSSDQSEIVALNRARVAEDLGVSPDRLVTAHQTHSARAMIIDAPLPKPLPKVDALVTRTPGLAVAVLTADCQPVLMADREAGVVAAVHAGWRGALDGVLEAAVETMEEAGADRARIRAAIGPSISQSAYEVGEDFFERFMDDDAENHRFFVNGVPGKYQFDLPAYGLARLRAAGVAEAFWTRHCTYSDPGRFYSFRRATHAAEADYGRQIAAIRLADPA